jgi:hypothetical protein
MNNQEDDKALYFPDDAILPVVIYLVKKRSDLFIN